MSPLWPGNPSSNTAKRPAGDELLYMTRTLALLALAAFALCLTSCAVEETATPASTTTTTTHSEHTVTTPATHSPGGY
jgi:hypothetical protein